MNAGDGRDFNAIASQYAKYVNFAGPLIIRRCGAMDRCREHQGGQRNSAQGLPRPIRMVRHRLAPGKLLPARHVIEQSPMAADSPFQRALPGLVERLDHVDTEVLLPAALQHVGDNTRLIRRRRERPRAHAPGAWPTRLASDPHTRSLCQENFRRRACGSHRHDRRHITRAATGSSLPIPGRDMDGNEVHCAGRVRDSIARTPRRQHM